MPQPSITVHKFGGAALADLDAFRHAAGIVASHGGEHPIIVVSAMRGVTDTLSLIARSAPDKARSALTALERRHRTVAAGLAGDRVHRAELTATVASTFDELVKVCTHKRRGALDASQLDFVISRGEVLAASLFVAALENVDCRPPASMR